ncbi:hypothetical protein AXX13_A0045 (plasmid) [Borrelia hermsii HS1]|uniref:BDR-repeat family protein n=3 Tax=Borrelia hermsii TaxID=140 RepID=T1EC71_BORHE|nr:hypothetical protein BHA013 [Borrelia hermsii]ANA43653.1 hypothetical protein AXX13_A0045 [Borrelia hermsii HS1]
MVFKDYFLLIIYLDLKSNRVEGVFMQNVKAKDNPYIAEKQIYSEFVRVGMHKAIAFDLSRRYYHNKLTYNVITIIAGFIFK